MNHALHKKPQRALVLTLIPVATLLMAGCNPTSTPLIDMCQKITQNLVGNVSEWKELGKSETKKLATVEVGYTTSDGQTGTAVCQHPKEYVTNEGRQEDTGKYRVAPETMTLNGVPVSSKDLVSASLGATTQIVKDTAENTKEKSVELAKEASEKAKELADQAEVMAADAKVKAEELAVKAESLAGDAKVKATELAQEARVKASELAAQASELSAVATEKARAAALEATKAVQEQLEK